MAEKEQTFEELMAELDAEASGGKTAPSAAPAKNADLSGASLDLNIDESPSAKTRDSEPDLLAGNKDPAPSQPAAPPAGGERAAAQSAGDEDAVLVNTTEEVGGEVDFSQFGQESKGKGLDEVKHVLGNLWSKAKSKAEQLRNEETRGEAAAKVSAFWDKATDALRTTATAVAAEAKATASDVAASARAMNSKILVKPQASFGVPLPLIAKRQCGDEEAPVVPALIETLLSLLDDHAAKNGPLALELLTKPLSSSERDSLKLLQDRIDQGEDVTQLHLQEEPRTLLSLLKLFLVEMPEPLLTYALYTEFLTAATPDGAASMADAASLLPPSHLALARRLLPALRTRFAPSVEALPRLAGALGVLMLRSKEKELRRALLDAVQVRNASQALLLHSDHVFAHSNWFLRNWFGVYSLVKSKGEMAEAFAVDDEAGGEEEESTELVVDAHAVTLGGKMAAAASLVDVGQWERKVNGPERVNLQMVVSMRVDDSAVTITFKDVTAAGGVEELTVTQADTLPSEGEAPRPARQLTGSFLRPLPWQDKVQAWGTAHTGIPFDEEEHPKQLQELWRLAFADRECPARKDKQWSELGFQQQDPSTDFRGAGMLALEALLHFAKTNTELYKTFLANSKGASPTEGYPFACGAINVTFMLLDSLLLLPSSIPHQGAESSGTEARLRRRGAQCRLKFGKLLLEVSDEMAPFHAIFLVAIKMLDKEWSSSARSYMYFNAVLDAVRSSVSNVLRSDTVSSLADLAQLQL